MTSTILLWRERVVGAIPSVQMQTKPNKKPNKQEISTSFYFFAFFSQNDQEMSEVLGHGSLADKTSRKASFATMIKMFRPLPLVVLIWYREIPTIAVVLVSVSPGRQALESHGTVMTGWHDEFGFFFGRKKNMVL